MSLFTRRERGVLWFVVALLLTLSALRLLETSRRWRLFREGEIIRTLDTERTPGAE